MPSLRRTTLPIAMLLAIGLVAGCGSSKKPTTSGTPTSSSSTTPSSSSTPSESPSPTTSSTSNLGSLSADDLLAASLQAVKDAMSVRMAGTQGDSSSSISLDLQYVGTDGSGTVTINGGVVNILSVGAKTFFKADDLFWNNQFKKKKAREIISVINGRWVLLDPGNKQFADLITLSHKGFVTDVALHPDSAIKLGDSAVVHGINCLSVTSTSGTLYIDAASGRPVEISGSSASEGKVEFTYDDAPAPTEPAASDVLDFKDLS